MVEGRFKWNRKYCVTQMTKLSESGLETLKNAARSGGKILPPEVIIGVLYHNSCRSAYKRKKMEDKRCGQATETSFI